MHMNKQQGFRCVAERHHFGQTVSIYMVQETPTHVSVAQPIQMMSVPKEDVSTFPALMSMSMGMAQELMDSLWQAGLRPSEGTGSAGALKATQDHIKDLRDQIAVLSRLLYIKDGVQYEDIHGKQT